MPRSSRALRIFTLFLCPSTLLLGYFLRFLFPEPPAIDKDGWINTFFVKKGWFWTSLIMWLCVFRYDKFSYRSFTRYAILTTWWYVFTQGVWFHTAPIMDLIFVATGGLCQFDVLDTDGNLNSSFQDSSSRRLRSLTKIHSFLQRFQWSTQDELKRSLASHTLVTLRRLMGNSNTEPGLKEPIVSPSEINVFIHDSIKSLRNIGTSAACRITGGHWRGGHDPSGHIFLNTLMIMLLLGELWFIAPVAWSKLSSKGHEPLNHFTTLLDNSPLRNLVQMRPQTVEGKFRAVIILPARNCIRDLLRFILISTKYLIWDNPVLLLIAIVILWWYSLIVTTLVFHTLPEQISGLACAYLVAGGLYWYTIKSSATNQQV